MIDTITTNLRHVEPLFTLEPSDFSDNSIGPYHSSIGSHVRHILDIFQCVIQGLDLKHIDFTKRGRGVACETDAREALKYLEKTIADIEALETYDRATSLKLVDDLGDGSVTTQSTLGSALFQAHNHAVHHFAIIGHLLHRKSLSLPNTRFGINPSTP